jgi:pimeloyl-ACP methyl ester carboxylesterase
MGADPSDAALAATPEFLSAWIQNVAEMFVTGVVGYVDDRRADVNGWGTFDVRQITCPVTVLHGADDGLMPVANAHYTASIVPGATLRVFDGLGHFSILTKAIDVTTELLTTVNARATAR